MSAEIPESEMATLTPAEEAEFTVMNALAFDLMRLESQKKNERPPVWLCCSEEVRRDYLNKVAWMLKGKLGLSLTSGDDELIARVNPLVPQGTVARWKSVERHYKWLREQGDPTAYFT